jgi:hypothetical protein
VNDPNAAEWIVAVAGVVAAIATATAAVAAWISARASASTSREAREALAAAIEPELVLSIGVSVDEENPKVDYIEVRITNVSRHSATQLETSVTYDGGLVRKTRELLDPFSAGDDWFVEVRELSTRPFRPFEVVVRYSDPQGLVRYELSAAARPVPEGSLDVFDTTPTQKRRIK